MGPAFFVSLKIERKGGLKLKKMVLTACTVLMLFWSAAAWAAPPAQPSGDKLSAAGQFQSRLEVHPISIDEVVKKANGIADKVFLLAQAYSLPMVVISLVGGALFMIIGSWLGVKKALQGGFLIIFVGLLGFVLINFAPEIIGLTQNMGASVLK